MSECGEAGCGRGRKGAKVMVVGVNEHIPFPGSTLNIAEASQYLSFVLPSQYASAEKFTLPV